MTESDFNDLENFFNNMTSISSKEVKSSTAEYVNEDDDDDDDGVILVKTVFTDGSTHEAIMSKQCYLDMKLKTNKE